MRTGIIDCGTNTFNLLIRDSGSVELLYNDKLPVRLGEGGLNQNYIREEPMQRGIEALRSHHQTCRDYGVDEIYAFATSAVRSATNGQEFIAKAKEETGVHINLIDGMQEAELIYLGVNDALNLNEQNVLIMDIGGGSTEFIIGNGDGIVWKQSFDLGSSRLMEKFKPDDPIQQDKVSEINQYLDEQLIELVEAAKRYEIKTLIGSSGSFDTLAEMTVHHFKRPEVIQYQTSFDFKMYEYRTIADLMLSYDYVQRLNTPGMIPMRADLIVVACVLIDFVLEKLKLQVLKQSAYALKEGVFKTLENKEAIWQRS